MYSTNIHAFLTNAAERSFFLFNRLNTFLQTEYVLNLKENISILILVHFNLGPFKDWKQVVDYLCEKENINKLE